MICERCKIAGNLNGDLTKLQAVEEPGEKTLARINNLKEAIKHNHDHCTERDCMCQHRMGALVAREQEA